VALYGFTLSARASRHTGAAQEALAPLGSATSSVLDWTLERAHRRINRVRLYGKWTVQSDMVYDISTLTWERHLTPPCERSNHAHAIALKTACGPSVISGSSSHTTTPGCEQPSCFHSGATSAEHRPARLRVVSKLGVEGVGIPDEVWAGVPSGLVGVGVGRDDGASEVGEGGTPFQRVVTEDGAEGLRALTRTASGCAATIGGELSAALVRVVTKVWRHTGYREHLRCHDACVGTRCSKQRVCLARGSQQHNQTSHFLRASLRQNSVLSTCSPVFSGALLWASRRILF